MEENKLTEFKSSAQIVRLDESNACFYIKNGFLALKKNDGEEIREFDRVFLHRDFPHELLYEYVSVLDDESREIGLIYSIDDFDSQTVAILKDEIAKKYYSPIIKEIKSVKERYGFSYWKVVCLDGRSVSFTMQDTFKNILHISDDSLMLVDVDSNRFTIESLSSLGVKSYRKIELYL